MRKKNLEAFLIIGLASGLIITTLSACSESSDEVSVEDFKVACEATTNMGSAICECVGNNAKRDLSPKGFQFLTAMMQKDNEKVTVLREQMEFADLTAASLYMVSGPASCAAEQ